MKKLRIIGLISSETEKLVDEFLANLEQDEKFEVILSSPGGSAMVGIGIYNRLKDYKPSVKIISHASSAASLIALAGGEIIADTGAVELIHNPHMITGGDSDKLRSAADSLDEIGKSALSIYMTRFKGNREEMIAIMKQDKFHSAEQLKKWGLIDKIVNEGEIAEEEEIKKAAAWIPETLLSNENYTSQYLEKLKLQQGITDSDLENISINTKHKEDSNMDNAEMQAKLSAFEKKFDDYTAKLEEKDNELASLNEEKEAVMQEKADLESKLETASNDLETANTKLAEIEKANSEAEVEAFMKENDDRYTAKQKDFWKTTLLNAKNEGEDNYKAAKEALKENPKVDLYEEQADAERKENDEVVMTKEELKKTDFANLDASIPENDRKISLAIEMYKKDNPDMSRAEIEEKLLTGGKI